MSSIFNLIFYLMEEFYSRLRHIRQQQNLSIKQLSEMSGLSYRTIQSYELKDRTPAIIDTLITLSRCLGVSVDYLIGISDDPCPVSSLTVSIDDIGGRREK